MKREIGIWVQHFQGLGQPPPWRHVDEVPTEFIYTERPKLTWGSGIYYAQSDGTLILLEDDYDTSD